MLTNTLIYAGLLPLVVAAVAAFAARRLSAAPTAALASGVAFGYIAAQFGLKSQAGFGVAVRSIIQPMDAADWLPLLALVAWAVTLLLVSKWWPARFVAAAFAVAVPMRLLAGHARITREWSPLEKLGYLSLLAAIIGFLWLLLATEDEDQPSSGRLPCVVSVAVGIAIALTLAGAFTYGQLCAALAASLTGAALACYFHLPLPPGEGRGEGALSGTTGSASANPSGATAGLPSSASHTPDSTLPNAPSSHHLAPTSRATGFASANPPNSDHATKRLSIPGFTGAAGVTACLLVGLILLGHFYAELPNSNAVLLIAALAAASAPLPKLLAAHPAWLHIAARALLCLTPLTIALASLLRESNPY